MLDTLREQDQEFFGNTTADQHRAWHVENRWPADRPGCPWDCVDSAPEDDYRLTDTDVRRIITNEVAHRGIRCGHCHGRHESTTAVFACPWRTAKQAGRVTR